jgi:hypothetical protein
VDALSYEFRLSDREFERAWLAEYFRRPGLARLRVLLGPAIAIFGINLIRGASDRVGVAIGVVAILLGVWHVARPFVIVRAAVRHRRKTGAAERTMRVRVGEEGIAISDGVKETRLPWDQVTGAGRASEYVWFEVRRSARATIPLGAIGDVAALEQAFRARGKWR